MDYIAGLDSYDIKTSIGDMCGDIDNAGKRADQNNNAEVWKRCFACLDLTLLSYDDTAERVTEFVGKAVEFHSHFPAIPNAAAVCVWPAFVDTAGLVASSSELAIASVAAGFPSAQTYLEVKMLEVAMAVENGADELDIVINPGRFLSGDLEALGSEISFLKEEAGEDVVVKVIIESGILKTPENIFNASLLAMMAGADFIKTSTGKATVSATPEAAAVMCRAIKVFYEKTGRRVGFKVAGGVRTVEEAVLYFSIVETVLGEQWLDPKLFRIGASSLADRLLTAIEGREVHYF